MSDFQMIRLTAVDEEPVWIAVHQICAIKAATDTTDGETEIYLTGHQFRCTETVAEVTQMIVNVLNGDIS